MTPQALPGIGSKRFSTPAGSALRRVCRWHRHGRQNRTSRQLAGELDLQIPSRLVNLDTIVLTETVQQHDALSQHATQESPLQ